MHTSTHYGFWNYWSIYDTPSDLFGDQKVTFDGPNKLVLVNQGVTELNFETDVYSAWKEWVKDPYHLNAGYEEALSAIGGDDLPGERKLGTTFFFENGWRMRTWEGNHELVLSGNVFTREGEAIFIPTLDPWTITINLNTSTLVEVVTPSISIDQSTIDGIAAASADAVWDEPVADHQNAGSTGETIKDTNDEVKNRLKRNEYLARI
jgi:hypothetical protein